MCFGLYWPSSGCLQQNYALCVVCELKYIAITRGKIEVTREEFLIPKYGSLFSFLRGGHKPEQAKTVLEGTSYRTFAFDTHISPFLLLVLYRSNSECDV